MQKDGDRMAANYLERYVYQYGDKTFAQMPPNVVDDLTFAMLAYLDYDRLPAGMYRLADLAGEETVQAAVSARAWAPEKYGQLLRALALSPRFSSVRWHRHRERLDDIAMEQFGAVTLEWAPQTYFLAYRGTNSTVAGWKEDLNMGYQPAVPAQRAAVRYLRETRAALPGRYMIGGHSKGGNLAVYAALHSAPALTEDLVQIFNFDGPGFLPDPAADQRYDALAARITKLVPTGSVVGLLLEHHQDYAVVASDSVSFWQHDPFNWRIHGTDFEYRPQTDAAAQFTQATFTAWLDGLSTAERAAILASLFTVADAGQADTMAELRHLTPDRVRAFYHAARTLPTESRAVWKKSAHSLWHALRSK